MFQYILTVTEAKILRAIPGSEGANLYELASTTKLIPSEVSGVVSHLVEKRLAEPLGERPFVWLTDEGLKVRHLLEAPRSKPQYRSHEPQRVLIVADETDQPVRSLDEADIDAALERELGKISGDQRG